uniref:Uncharacterized protein n=1 Tax=Arundo donax TaxID=35708 RepID=A0A0A9QPW3_ARUDO
MTSPATQKELMRLSVVGRIFRQLISSSTAAGEATADTARAAMSALALRNWMRTIDVSTLSLCKDVIWVVK